MELFQHQERILLRNPHKFLLAFGTGTGKTRTSIELAIQNKVSFIVICPKGLQENWRREIEKWNQGRITTDYLVISKETFRRDWATIDGFQAIIVDEAHVFAGMGSQMSKSLLSYIKRWTPSFIWLLTATPYLRNAWNVYMLGKILGYNWNYAAFRSSFFMERYFGQRTVWVPKPGKENEIARLVNEIGMTVKLEDCIDYPEATYETEYFKATKEQVRATEAIQEALPIVRFTKYHQICGGTLKGNEYEESKKIASEKTKRVLELVAGNDKLIISCRYIEEMAMLATEIIGATEGDCPIYMISGNVKDKQAIIDQFNESPRAVLIANAMCSEGWQAPTAQVMVFYSLDFSLKNYIQMQGRIRRIDRPQKVTYVSLIVKDSIDEDVAASVEAKHDFQTAIYEYNHTMKI